MRDRLDEFPPNTALALVVFARRELVVDYVARNGIDIPVMLDETRSVYSAYGLERGSARRIWSIGAARRYLEIIRRDGVGVLARPTEDTRQLGGDFVVDPDGRLAWAHRGAGPDDRPPVDQLIRAAASADRRPGP